MATFPERVVASLNGASVAIVDAVFGPLLRLPPLIGVLVVSLVTAMVLVLLMRRISDQQRLRATRRRLQAALFEIRLSADDPVAVLQSFRDVMVQNVIYLRLNLVPLLWLIVPLSLLIAQLQAVYGYTGLMRHDPALITVEFANRASAATLEAPAEIRVETEPVQLMGTTDIVWRIVPSVEGVFSVTVRSGDSAVTKSVVVGDRLARRSPLRTQAGLERQLLYPSESIIPADSSIAGVAVDYPAARINLLGWRVHWLIVYGLFSVLWALLFSRWFGVAI